MSFRFFKKRTAKANMPDPEIPAEAPPSYAQATGTSQEARNSDPSGHLRIPSARNRIPVNDRRSMEDENRPLPEGWTRQFDPRHEHQFFVDTTKEPPRSIWHHPYDDEDYLATLNHEERARIKAINKAPNKRDTESISTDGSAEDDSRSSKEETNNASRPTTSSSAVTGSDMQPKSKFGRRLKDKITGTTHEQRVVEREQRAREEEAQYEQYLAMRGAMKRAYQTGEPQLLGKDKDGRDIYVEPPGGYRGRPGGYSNNVYLSPYAQGPYSNPNARFVRPGGPYSRPYGAGYGGGLGLPIAGGIAGGLLLGGALGGFGA